MSICEHGVNIKHCLACKKKNTPAKRTDSTDEQIENLRLVLFTIVGPYAAIMSRNQIIGFRDKFQTEIDELSETLK